MEIDVGAKVRCRDGEAGVVRYVILDRDTADLSGIVVDATGLLGFDIVVPRDLVGRVAHDALDLSCALADLKRLAAYDGEHYEPADPSDVPPSWPDPSSVRYPVAARRLERPSPAPERSLVREGLTVSCVDGPCGTVDELVPDPETGRLSAFLVRKGELLHQDIVVPLSAVRRVSESGIELNIDKKGLRDFAVRVDRAA